MSPTSIQLQQLSLVEKVDINKFLQQTKNGNQHKVWNACEE